MKPELDFSTKMQMIGFALFVDFLLDGAFLFIPFIPDLIATLVFKYWLRKYDIELFGGGRSILSTATVVFEAMPGIGLLPIWTTRIASIVFFQ